MSQEKVFSIHVINMKSKTHQKFLILIIFYERINGDKNNESLCAANIFIFTLVKFGKFTFR